tara:strand:+ start:71 stop:256 length:186 start_codon:yes stop_codon:yes gene_type:complete
MYKYIIIKKTLGFEKPKYNIPYDVEMGCESKEEAARKIRALMDLEEWDSNFPTDYQIMEVA